MISHRRLSRRRSIPAGSGPVVIDSGGFSELSLFGGWRTTQAEYAAACAVYVDRIGTVEWVAPQDWMCEPAMIARTGLTVIEHQRRTVAGFCTIRHRHPELPVIPVLQGWRLDDYHRCAAMYQDAGIDLAAERIVGLGSVCRRQDTGEISEIAAAMHDRGFRLHGFGVKSGGMGRYGAFLDSADSLAWSFAARRERRSLPGCSHSRCANCLPYALRWREQLLARNLGTDIQLPLFAR